MEEKRIPSELARRNDISLTDACFPINRPGIYQNPIEIWFENPDIIEKYGVEETKDLVSWAKAKCPLDPRVDEPLPNWAIDIMRLGRIGYKGRIKIMMTHAEDIARYRLIKRRSDIQ